MSGIALDEISSNLQEFQGVKKLSKSFFRVTYRDFRNFQFWRNDHIGPDFESSYLNVSCNISATTPPILDSDGVFEPSDP